MSAADDAWGQIDGSRQRRRRAPIWPRENASKMAVIKVFAASMLILACFCRSTNQDLIDIIEGNDEGEDFESVTSELNFRAIYRLQTFAEGEPQSVCEVYESYQSDLEAASIKQVTREWHDDQLVELDRRRWIYQGQLGRLVELVVPSEHPDEDQFYLNENGASSSYDFVVQENSPSVGLVTGSASQLDSNLLLAGTANEHAPSLDLDRFLTDGCRKLVRERLHYIRGVSRLLLLVECRRSEFSLQRPRRGSQATRGMRHEVFEASLGAISADLHLSSDISKLQLTVTVPSFDSPTSQNDSRHSMPRRMVPLSIGLRFDPNITVLVNIFQFESVVEMEHLSESAGSESVYMLPLLRGELSSVQSLKEESLARPPKRTFDQFSFRAQLQSQQLSDVFGPDPIQLIVAFDRQSQTLVRQINLADRSRSLGDSWARQTSQLVLDGQMGLKFHMMDEPAKEGDGLLGGNKWHSCAIDKLNIVETIELETGGSEAFDLRGSHFMGIAIVRGIYCYVYEKRIYRLPLWLGLGEVGWQVGEESSESLEIYADLYLMATKLADQADRTEQQLDRADDETLSRPVRLDLSLRNQIDGARRSLRLDLFSFDWSNHLLADVPDLLQVAEECLGRRQNWRSMDLELLLELERGRISREDEQQVSKRLFELQFDEKLRQEAVSSSLVDSFGLSRAQQVDLEAKWQSASQLHVRLTILEPANERLQFNRLGPARDLSVGSATRPRQWSVGAASVSAEECKWRAAHLLTMVGNGAGFSSLEASPRARQLFMFCPRTLHCVIGDESWQPIVRQQALRINSTLDYPARAGSTADVCSALSVAIRREANSPNKRRLDQRRGQRSGRLQTGGWPLIDWLAANQHSGRVRGVPFELKVSEALGRVAMRTVKFRVSATGGSGGGDDAMANELSLPRRFPRRALVGLAFAGSNQTERPLEPLVAVELAQCSRICLMLHQCNSYSACHEADGMSSRLSCLFSRLKWSDQAEESLAELEQLSARKLPGGLANLTLLLAAGRPVGRAAAATDEIERRQQQALRAEAVEVRFRQSKLCSLHGRQQVSAYKFKGSSENAIPPGEFLIYANSSDRCARFCLERAQLWRSIEPPAEGTPVVADQLSRFREAACWAFRFSAERSRCELLPLQRHRQLLGGAAGGGPPLDRWRRWLDWDTPAEWLAEQSMGPDFAESDLYELDFEQLFVAQEGRRLVPVGHQQQADRHQLVLSNLGPAECAQHCIHSKGCRSFDSLQAGRPGSSQLCNLNAASLADLAASEAGSAPLELEQIRGVGPGGGQQSQQVWWHYEPSELALYTLTDSISLGPDSQRAAKDEDEAEAEANMFIHLKPGSWAPLGALMAKDRLASSSEPKPVEGSAGKSFAWLWLTAMLLVLISSLVCFCQPAAARFACRASSNWSRM